MLDIRAYFDRNRFSELLVGLSKLPIPLRPQYFSGGEKLGSKANRVDNAHLFSEFVRVNPGGFFLFADDALYRISIAGEGPAYFFATSSGELPKEIIHTIFDAVARLDVPFALAADNNEYEHRNRIFHKIGKNNIESWVGRDIKKYLSGLYWYTMISDDLLHEHGIDLAVLEENAISMEKLGCCNLLKFFEAPQDWASHATKLDDLCESTKGIFSARTVNEAVGKASSYSEYSERVRSWR